MKTIKITVFAMMLVFISCEKDETLPVPEEVPVVTVNTNNQNTTNPYLNTFIGNWVCNDWVVDDMSGATRKREILLSYKSETTLNFSLNDYTTSTTFNQLITNSTALLDTSYFINPNNPISDKYKGYLTTDSTLEVSKYDGVIIYQTKEFKKN